MGYVLVGVTLIVMAATMAGVAVLGNDRIFPARKVLGYIAADGIDVETDYRPVWTTTDRAGNGYRKIQFSTSPHGYTVAEVDEAFAALMEENRRMRSELELLQARPESL